MPDGGIIQIKAENVFIDEKSLMPLETGSYIKIYVRDQGKGILKQNLTKIFDPFFTTKPNGTGLGLATSYAIVKRHGGHITVESEVGVGSTFYIFLPVSNKAIAAKKASETKEYTDGGRILIMDDQESIRNILGKMLTLMNCECHYAEDGHQAVQSYMEKMKSENKFDLVFMDLTIPGGMGGKDTIKTLKSIDPDITAVVASGYSNDPVMANYEDYGFAGRLEKPFKIDDLRKLMRQVLGNKIKNKNSGGAKNG
jgi:CheY-like chemotaxis protein